MPLQNEYNKDTIKESILNKLLRYYGCTIEDATPKQVYAAVAVFRILLRELVREEFRLLTVEFDSVMLLYRSKSESYSVSVTLELASMPSFEIYT